jgi:hypothetical protein
MPEAKQPQDGKLTERPSSSCRRTAEEGMPAALARVWVLLPPILFTLAAAYLITQVVLMLYDVFGTLAALWHQLAVGRL